MKALLAVLAATLAGCAAAPMGAKTEAGVVSFAAQETAQTAATADAPRELKRKVAIGRFTNVTRYGKGLLTSGSPDPLANQAADILANRLVETGRFLVFDRPSIAGAEAIGAADAAAADLAGMDAIVVGSVTEFGRRDEGRAGFISSSKRQVVEATVEARLIEVSTGRVFFTASGSGAAMSEHGEVLGYGSRAAYDATLNDKALSAAIADMMNEVVQKLAARPWSTDVLAVRDGAPLISGGPAQGVQPGDRFAVLRRGQRIAGASTGTLVELPGEELAQIEVVSFFGADELSQGATTRIVSGSIAPDADLTTLKVAEIAP
jgi:curli biogenesis system outer membrane secretion channel CsgG